MLNRLCAPELSFNSGNMEPHALVSFMDGAKECVPLRYVLKFPTDWRTGGWDTSKLFHVFWSPDVNDSPTEVLKTQAEIPKFECDGKGQEKAGYHRAAIILVKGSEEELNEAVENGKRISMTRRELMHSSFDASTSSKMTSRTDNKRRKSGSTSTSAPSKQEKASKKEHNDKKTGKKHNSSSSKKKTGINTVAQVKNTKDIKDIVASLIKSETVIDNTEVPNNGSGELDVEKTVQANTELQTKKEAATISSNKQYQEVPNPKSNDGSQLQSQEDKKDSAAQPCKIDCDGEASPVLSGIKEPCFFKTGKKKHSSSDSYDSSDDESVTVSGKKVCLDPDWTPIKYLKLKQDLEIKEQTIKKVNALNVRLQENLMKADDKINSLINQLSEKCKKCSAHRNSGPDHNKHVLSISKEHQTESSFEKVSEDVCESPQNKIAINTIRVKCEDELLQKPNLYSKEADLLQMDDGCKVESEDLNPLDCCEATLHDTDEKADLRKSGGSSGESKLSSLLQSLKIASDIQEVIRSIGRGERKDIRFIKDLAIVAFGPETLASSTVSGTKRGPKKKDNNEAKPKPPLEKDMLDKVYDVFVERVQEEEDKTIQAPKTYDRTKVTRFSEAIRGAQKKLRGMGYGVGNKCNTVCDQLMIE